MVSKVMIYKYHRQQYFRLTIPFFVVLTLGGIALQIYNKNINGGIVYRDHFFVYLGPFWYRCVGGIMSHYPQICYINISVNTNFRRVIMELIAYGLLLHIAFADYWVALH